MEKGKLPYCSLLLSPIVSMMGPMQSGAGWAGSPLRVSDHSCPPVARGHWSADIGVHDFEASWRKFLQLLMFLLFTHTNTDIHTPETCPTHPTCHAVQDIQFDYDAGQLNVNIRLWMCNELKQGWTWLGVIQEPCVSSSLAHVVLHGGVALQLANIDITNWLSPTPL